MDRQTSLDILAKVRQKTASQGRTFADAINAAAGQDVQSQALANLSSLGLLGLGVGGAARGGVGLYNQLRRATQPLKTRSGPAIMTLPYPVEGPEGVADEEDGPKKVANFLAGGQASQPSGIPWYYPAAVMTTLGGGMLGWKGVDAALNARRKKERQDELNAARQEFHDALLSQYDKPRKATPGLKQASDLAMGLDTLFDTWMAKQADLADMAGQAMGGYGVYAGLAGLGTGALVYDQVRKRQRRAIIDKAMKRRERRRFNTSPPEIVAVPEPVEHPRVEQGGGL